ncbi:PsbP-like protein 1, chloroplastic [Coccomyxa sp. Obi]|nr:PsbP-like protein 1, chloroplastic [Coccomyxa sp. Obi]
MRIYLSNGKQIQVYKSSMALHLQGNGQFCSVPTGKSVARPFSPATHSRRPKLTTCQATQVETAPATATRRSALMAAAAATSALFSSNAIFPGAALAASKEFTPVKDTQDGYSFVYPFGWQEVAVKGQDIVYKDVIEPLESVSVSITQTDKANVAEFGSPAEVAVTLAEKVLTPPKQDVKVLDVSQKEKDGRMYYTFEFASKASNYIRHALAVVTVANGKFYTLTTGSNEKRWGKMKPRLEQVINSFEVVERYA